MTSWRSLCKPKATAGLWWAGMSHFWTWDLRRWWILGWPDNWTLPGPQDRLREQCFPLTDCYPDVCPQYVLYSLLPPLDRGICDSNYFYSSPKHLVLNPGYWCQVETSDWGEGEKWATVLLPQIVYQIPLATLQTSGFAISFWKAWMKSLYVIQSFQGWVQSVGLNIYLHNLTQG